MNKPLTLGVVAALGIAGGQATAATCVDTTVAAIRAPTFSCTLGDATYSNFELSPGMQFGHVLVDFDLSGSNSSIAFERAPIANGFAMDSRFMQYTFTLNAQAIAEGTTLLEHTLGLAASVSATTENHLTGNLSGLTIFGLSGTDAQKETPLNDDTSAVIRIATPQSLNLLSLTSTFTESAEAAVPEPMSLSLFGLGLTGLALARRRPGRSN